MTRRAKYKEPMTNVLARIKETDHEILKRNASEKENVTEMIQRAVQILINQEGWR